jgi:hypothetical protein
MELNELFNEKELFEIISPSFKSVVVSLESQGKSLEEIGELSATMPYQNISQKGGSVWKSDIWPRIQKELTLILCTEDVKYEKLRNNLNNQMSQKALIALIAGAVGTQIGIAGTAIITFIVLGVTIFLRASKEGICSYYIEKFEL